MIETETQHAFLFTKTLQMLFPLVFVVFLTERSEFAVTIDKLNIIYFVIFHFGSIQLLRRSQKSPKIPPLPNSHAFLTHLSRFSHACTIYPQNWVVQEIDTFYNAPVAVKACVQ